MKRETRDRLERLEEIATIAPRIRFVWVEPGDTIAKSIAAAKAGGHIADGDRVVPIAWRTGGTERPILPHREPGGHQ
jgi:hypothetical protein